jgi:hypothetical protein
LSASAFFIVDKKWFPLSLVQAIQARRLSGPDLQIHIFVESQDVEHLEPDESAAAASGIIVHRNELGRWIPPGLPATTAWPSLVYGRCFAHHILNSDRLVYLDSDIIISEPLDRLIDLDLRGASLAAAHCAESLADPNRSNSYFNAGVMLIDRDRWMRHDMLKSCVEFFQRNGPTAKFQDQDFLNALFAQDWRPLSPRWNFQPPYMDTGLFGALTPAIHHFWGRWKPWHPTATKSLSEIARLYRAQARAAGIDPDALCAAIPANSLGLRKRIRGTLAKRLFEAGIYTPRMRNRLARLLQKQQFYCEFFSQTEFADAAEFDRAAFRSEVQFDGRRFSLG